MTIMISKPDFMEILSYIQSMDECANKVNKVYESYNLRSDFMDAFAFVPMKGVDYIIQLLEKLMNDTGSEWIEWWVYETHFGKLDCSFNLGKDDPTERYIRTAGELYDYLWIWDQEKNQ